MAERTSEEMGRYLRGFNLLSRYLTMSTCFLIQPVLRDAMRMF